MRCPLCNERKTQVIDSRKKEDHFYRRRECSNCNSRFTTEERSAHELSEFGEKYRRLEEAYEELQAWRRTLEERTFGYTLRKIEARPKPRKVRRKNRRKAKGNVSQGVCDGGVAK